MDSPDAPSQYAGRSVLITGGAGFIGSSLALELVRLGAKVTVLDAMLPLYGGNMFNLEPAQGEVEFVQGDIRDEATVNRLVAGKDFIFDLAAQVSYIDSRDLPILDEDINARGHLVVLEAMRHHAPDATLVFASSRLVYGQILTNPVAEDHPTEPLSLYGIHKLTGEKYCRYYSRTFGLKASVVRIPNPYGPRQQMKHAKYSIVGWFMRQAMEGKPIRVFGDGSQLRDYIYIDDITSALLGVGLRGKPGEVYNIGTSEKTRFIDMIDAIISAVGSGSRELVPWPKNYEKNETGDYFADTSRISADVGWAATVPLAEGIGRMLEYYRANRDRYWSSGDVAISSAMESVARKYMGRRFPRATEAEREKVVADWVGKVRHGRLIAEDFKRRVGDPNGLAILDVGSGPGGTAVAFAEAGAKVDGVDIEPELADISSQLATDAGVNVRFTCYDGGKLPFPDASFDAAVSISVLEHVSDPVLYLAEILRTLRPGGSLYLAFPNRLWPKETHTGLYFVSYLPRAATDRVVRWFGRNPLDDNNLHFYTYRQLKRMVAAAQVAAGATWSIVPEAGTSRQLAKVALRWLLAKLGTSHRAFLPHISFILRRD